MAKAPAAPLPIRRADWTPPLWLVPEATLDIALDPERIRVRARLEVRRNGAHQAPLRLHGVGLKLLSLTVDGRAAAAKRDAAGLTLRIAGDAATVETLVEIAPGAEQYGLFALGDLLATQCEPEGFRRITFFPDRPDVLTRFRVRLEGDKARYPVLLSNGNPEGAGEEAGGRHWAAFDDPWPKPCYLFALLAGPLEARRDAFVTRSGREVALAAWTLTGGGAPAGEALDHLKAAMAWDEQAYGREYDLDALNLALLPGFGFGAMENKGLLFFEAGSFPDPETATDEDRDLAAMLVAHEYLHNWSGNRVTIRDWFELGWKEGFTVFRDQGFSASRGSPAARRIDDVRALRSGGGAGPVRPETCTDLRGLFSRGTYTKAAEIVRMGEAALGPERFRRAASAFFDAADGTPVTWEDFFAALGDDAELAEAAAWIARPDMPKLLPDLPDAPQALAALAAEEGEALLRWHAMQTLLTKAVLGKVDEALALPPARAALALDDAALVARLLDLPHWTEIAAATRPFEPGRVQAGLARVRRSLGAALEPEWRALQAAPAADAGRRALRNLALDYLVAEAPDAGALALAQLKDGPTFTEREGALRALAHSDLAERPEGLAAFHAAWGERPAALDRWFAAQASSRRPTALEEARRLLAHPDFSLGRGPRVGALLGGVGRNLAALHHPSGLGYRFLADAALALHGTSPAAAARVAAPLLSGPVLEPRLAALLAEQVERLRASGFVAVGAASGTAAAGRG